MVDLQELEMEDLGETEMFEFEGPDGEGGLYGGSFEGGGLYEEESLFEGEGIFEGEGLFEEESLFEGLDPESSLFEGTTV